MIVQAENDEIVEKWMAPEIQKVAIEKGMSVDFFCHEKCPAFRVYDIYGVSRVD